MIRYYIKADVDPFADDTECRSFEDQLKDFAEQIYCIDVVDRVKVVREEDLDA